MMVNVYCEGLLVTECEHDHPYLVSLICRLFQDSEQAIKDLLSGAQLVATDWDKAYIKIEGKA